MIPGKKSVILFILACLFVSGISFAQAQPAEIYNNGGFNSAIKLYRGIADRNEITGYLNLAAIFKDLARYELGIKVLNAARSRFKDDFRLLGYLGRMYYLNGQLEQSISVLERLSRIKPNDREALITLGLCYQEKGNDAAALGYFQKTLDVDSNNVIARLSLADIYCRQNKLEESAKEYKALSFIDASLNQIYEYWADILFKIGSYKEALKLYERISFIEPQNKNALDKLETIRDKFGKEYFEKEKVKKELSRGRKLVFVKPLAKIKNGANVRIGLVRTDGSAQFKCSTGFSVKTRNGRILVGQGLAGQAYTILQSGANRLLISRGQSENMVVDEPVVVSPDKPEGTVTLFEVKFGDNNFWSSAEDRSYRGEMELSIDNGIIKIINVLSVEEYLYGVVPSEMPSNWPLEALKTQAVAARSETMAKLGRHRSDGFDLCAEVHCQVYSGVEKETELGNMAVDSTRGIILEYNSKAVDAIYSSNCGGHTQDNIFGDKEAVAYFTGVEDTDDAHKPVFPLSPFEMESWLKDPPAGIYCNIPEYGKMSSFRWIRIYSAQQMRQLIDNFSPVGEIKRIVVTRRNLSGHVDKLKIVGSDGSCIIEKELNIRRVLGNLRSSMFKVEAKYGKDHALKDFIFYGGGWGHGVGMCQAGSCGMAKSGKSYQEILRHYFSRAHLKKIY
jgi:stage II sporulation protein D